MPREDRRIVFDYAETYKAIFALCVKKEMPRLFVGAIAAITFKANDDKIVVVRFADELQGKGGHKRIQPGFPGSGAGAVLPDLRYSCPEERPEIGGTRRG